MIEGTSVVAFGTHDMAHAVSSPQAWVRMQLSLRSALTRSISSLSHIGALQDLQKTHTRVRDSG